MCALLCWVSLPFNATPKSTFRLICFCFTLFSTLFHIVSNSYRPPKCRCRNLQGNRLPSCKPSHIPTSHYLQTHLYIVHICHKCSLSNTFSHTLKRGLRGWKPTLLYQLGSEVFRASWKWHLCKEAFAGRRSCGVCTERFAHEVRDAYLDFCTFSVLSLSYKLKRLEVRQQAKLLELLS